ncbi:hypothetical protein HMI54_014578 [Coelomomyces lativittatus]|nr:hypothetical protein HMI54_014578 [Coelomomyces lativittatus]
MEMQEEVKKDSHSPEGRTSSFTTTDKKDGLRGRSSSPHQLICQRCHAIQYANQTSISIPGHSPSSLVHQIHHLPQHTHSRRLVIHLVDLLDFPLTFFPIRHRFPHSTEHVLVFTKVDLVPCTVPYPHVLTWAQQVVQHTLQASKTRPPTCVHVVSSKSGVGIRELFQDLYQLGVKKGVQQFMVIGATNVGKSEFLNCLHRMVRYPKEATPHVTSARIPGTTVAPIAFPLARFSGLFKVPSTEVGSAELIDTPGVSLEGPSLMSYVTQSDLRRWHVGRRLVPRGYTVPTHTSLFLGHLIRIDVLPWDENPSIRPFQRIGLTVWTSPLVHIHVTNLQKADRFCQSQTFPPLLLPTRSSASASSASSPHPDPTPSSSVVSPPLTLAGSFTLDQSQGWKEQCTEFAFGGVGFISVCGDFEKVHLAIYTVGGKGVAQRVPLLPLEVPKKWVRVQGTRPKPRESSG